MLLRRLLLFLSPSKRRQRQREFDEELRANLALAVEDALDRSHGPDAARQARRDFGNLAIAREHARAVWFPGWDALAQDVHVSLRVLGRSPSFTCVAILSLALGIAAAASLFSLVSAVVLKPLAYREPGRLIHIREVVKPLAGVYPTMPVNYQHFLYWRDRVRSFESICAITAGTTVLGAAGDSETVGAAWVSGEFFQTLGIQPRYGRAFTRQNEQPAAPYTVILSDSLWRRRLGGTPSIIGAKILLNGNPYTVAGILAPDFRFPKNDELGPLATLPEHTELFLPITSYSDDWIGEYDFISLARLRPGVTQTQATAELNALEKQISQVHPGTLTAGLTVLTRPMQDVIASPVRQSLAILLAAVLLLVLIVCVNLANLLLARATVRAREYALRIALGAGRSRIAIAALIETAIVSLAGGALGIAAAWAAVNAFVRYAPIDIPRADEARVDSGVVAFAFGLSLLCALLFGILPALRLSQADPQLALRAGGYSATGPRAGLSLRQWLIGAEAALSTLLLVLAGLLVSSLYNVLHVDRGFSSQRTLDAAVTLPPKYSTDSARAAFWDRAIVALHATAGVRAVAAVNKPPLTGESNVNDVSVDGAQDSSFDPVSRIRIEVNDRFISPQYFTVLGIPLLRGRDFEPADRNRNVAIVSARLAAKLLPGRDPLGHTVSSGSRISHAQIVGVVGDVHTTQLDRDPTMMVYSPYWKDAGQIRDLVIRAEGDPRTIEQEVRRTIRSLDPAIAAPDLRTMQGLVDKSVARRRFQMDVAAGFGIAALLLAALGIYGVVAYSVALRRREMGVRMALGARAAQLQRNVIWRGLRPVLAGLATGIAAALAAGQLVRTLLFGVTATDPLTIAAAAGALTAVALAACLLPALTAARIDPARILRDE